MQLSEQIDQDINSALKAGETDRLSTLRMLKNSIKNIQIEQKEELDDSAVIKVIKKEIKQRQDANKMYEEHGESERAQKELSEIEILEPYLPEQISGEELEKIIDEAIETTGASSLSDMGRVMSAVMSKVGDNADGSKVSALVKTKLS